MGSCLRWKLKCIPKKYRSEFYNRPRGSTHSPLLGCFRTFQWVPLGYSTRQSQFVQSLSDRLSHLVTSALLCALLLLNLLVLMPIQLYIIIPVSGYFMDSVILSSVGLFNQYSLNSHYFSNFSNAPFPQATLHIPWNTLYMTIFYDVVTWIKLSGLRSGSVQPPFGWPWTWTELSLSHLSDPDPIPMVQHWTGSTWVWTGSAWFWPMSNPNVVILPNLDILPTNFSQITKMTLFLCLPAD